MKEDKPFESIIDPLKLEVFDFFFNGCKDSISFWLWFNINGGKSIY